MRSRHGAQGALRLVFMCDRGLQSQCETTQVKEHGTGGSLFGYTRFYGEVPGGQAEHLRVPQARYGPIKVPEGAPECSISAIATTSARRSGAAPQAGDRIR